MKNQAIAVATILRAIADALEADGMPPADVKHIYRCKNCGHALEMNYDHVDNGLIALKSSEHSLSCGGSFRHRRHESASHCFFYDQKIVHVGAFYSTFQDLD